MKLKNRILILPFFTVLIVFMFLISSHKEEKNLGDDLLLTLIKNDQKKFEEYISSGGSLSIQLPLIDGKSLNLSEGIIHFERVTFIKYLRERKMDFFHGDHATEKDLIPLAIKKNNIEILKLMLAENMNMSQVFGDEKWTILHFTSADCAHRLVSVIPNTNSMDWHSRDKNGLTPLNLAVERNCLPILSYLKEKGVDFSRRDGRGVSALDLLRKKKDMSFVAFTQSFEKSRFPASLSFRARPMEPDFYRKRQIPSDKVKSESDLIEPVLRPDEANETADYTEFSD